MDPIDFLVQHDPFARLGDEGRRRVEATLEIDYARAGEVLLTRDGDPAAALSVVRKGSVRLQVDGRVVDELGEGEAFGFPSLLARSRPHFDVVCASECLLYRIPAEVFHELVEHDPGFGAHFRGGLADRLRHAVQDGPTTLAGDLAVPVGELARRAVVFVDRDATVGEAAERMRDERVSSVLVRGEPMGIVTDRDLRSRVLASGLGPTTPVADVMSSPLVTVDVGAPLVEALMQFLDRRLHHLPVEDGSEIVGLITHTDLLRHQVNSPSFLLRRVLQGDTVEGAHTEQIARMIEGLRSGGLGAVDIARVVAAVNDALVERCLRDAEELLGPPPCAYAWLVFGSEGRREQLLVTDQDNALVVEHDDAESRDYFARLARAVVDRLLASGIPECAGGFMATNWCHPLSKWEALFRSWIEQPEPQALMDVANLFDFRALHGGLSTERLDAIIAGAQHNSTFLAQLAKASLAMRPPIGLFHRVKQSPEGLDLKASAVMPVVGLARVVGMEAGTRERSTLGRLASARDRGQLSHEGADLLSEGFRFVLQLRLRLQLEALRRGEAPSNRVRMEDLERVEARHLKETLLEIRSMQQALAQRHRVELLA